MNTRRVVAGLALVSILLGSVQPASADPYFPIGAAQSDDSIDGAIDYPGPNATVTAGTAGSVRGWVVDRTAQGWPGIDDVRLALIAMPTGVTTDLGHGSVAQSRPDVGAALNNSAWFNAGFSFSNVVWPTVPGQYQLSIVAHTPSRGTWWQARVITVVAAQPAQVATGGGTSNASGLYRVQLSRVARNAYRDATSRVLLITRACIQLALGDDAIYDATQQRVIFSDGNQCQVAGVYRANAVLDRVGDNLYRDEQTGGYVRTTLCLDLALGEDALVLDDRVIFIADRDECDRSLF